MGTRSRKRAIVAAALGVAVLGIAWPVVGAAAPRHPLVAGAAPVTETFTDATGDSGDGPDVTTVVLSTDSTGKLAVTVSVPNRPSLTTEDAVQLFLDTDANSGTGGAGGFEYDIAWITGHSYLLHWDGSQFSDTGAKSFSGSYKDAQATAGVALSDLGGATAFNFILTTTGDNGDSTADRAPDGTAVWSWPPAKAPPPPPPPGSPPPPSSGLVTSKFVVGKAHAGRPFTVSMVVKAADSGLSVKTSVSCSARLAGKPLRASRKGSVLSGRASCTWRLPKHTQGEQLKGSITAHYQGAKVTRSFSRRILG